MILTISHVLSALLISTISLPLPCGEQEEGARIRKLALEDSRFQGEVRAFEDHLQEEELALLARSVPPQVSGPIAPVKGHQPVRIGRVLTTFSDGPKVLLNLQLLPYETGALSVHLDAGVDVRYVGISRRARRPTPGYIAYIWLREGSHVDAAQVAFGTEEAYRAWETSHRKQIDQTRRRIADSLKDKRAREIEVILQEAETRILQKERTKQQRTRERELKPRSSARGPTGLLLAVFPEKGDIKVSFRYKDQMQEETWHLVADGVVWIDRMGLGSLKDLGVGCSVKVWFADRERTSIGLVDARGPWVGGYEGSPPREIDVRKRSLTLLLGEEFNEPAKYSVVENAYVEIDGRRASLGDVDPKEPIRIRLSADMTRAIEVRQGWPPRRERK